MGCSTATLAGLGQDCLGSVGGIKAVYIGHYEEFTYSEESGLVAKEGATDGKLHRFFVRKQSSSMTSTFTADDANGVEYWQNDLALVFARQSKEKREQIIALTAGAPELICVAIDANNTYYLLGSNNPMTRTAGAAQTGTASTDANNYTLTLSETTDILPIIVDEAKVKAVLEEVA